MANRKLGGNDIELVTVSAHRFRYAARFVSRDIGHIHHAGGVRIEPIKEGERGVLIIATDGRRLVVIRDDEGRCHKAVTVQASEDMLKACEPPTLPFLVSEGERFHASHICAPPPEIVPAFACFSGIGAFVISKAGADKDKEGDAEDYPPSIWTEMADYRPKHWDYSTTFLTTEFLNWRPVMKAALDAPAAAMPCTELYPEQLADFGMWPVSSNPEDKPALRIDWRGFSKPAIVTIAEAPEMMGLIGLFIERDMPKANAEFMAFVKEVTEAPPPEGHPETEPEDRFRKPSPALSQGGDA